jgi:hypothetical protein
MAITAAASGTVLPGAFQASRKRAGRSTCSLIATTEPVRFVRPILAADSVWASRPAIGARSREKRTSS